MFATEAIVTPARLRRAYARPVRLLFCILLFTAFDPENNEFNGIAVQASGYCPTCTVAALAEAVPRLHGEIVGARDAQGRRRHGLEHDIECFGHMLFRSWPNLSTTEVPPFYCNVGTRSLTIDAPTTYRDATGRAIVWGEDGWREKAVRADIRKPRWMWTVDGQKGARWRE